MKGDSKMRTHVGVFSNKNNEKVSRFEAYLMSLREENRRVILTGNLSQILESDRNVKLAQIALEKMKGER